MQQHFTVLIPATVELATSVLFLILLINSFNILILNDNKNHLIDGTVFAIFILSF